MEILAAIGVIYMFLTASYLINEVTEKHNDPQHLEQSQDPDTRINR